MKIFEKSFRIKYLYLRIWLYNTYTTYLKNLQFLTVTFNMNNVFIFTMLFIIRYCYYFRDLSEKQNITLPIRLTQNITDRKSTLFVVWLDPCTDIFILFYCVGVKYMHIGSRSIIPLTVVSCTDAYKI